MPRDTSAIRRLADAISNLGLVSESTASKFTVATRIITENVNVTAASAEKLLKLINDIALGQNVPNRVNIGNPGNPLIVKAVELQKQYNAELARTNALKEQQARLNAQRLQNIIASPASAVGNGPVVSPLNVNPPPINPNALTEVFSVMDRLSATFLRKFSNDVNNLNRLALPAPQRMLALPAPRQEPQNVIYLPGTSPQINLGAPPPILALPPATKTFSEISDKGWETSLIKQPTYDQSGNLIVQNARERLLAEQTEAKRIELMRKNVAEEATLAKQRQTIAQEENDADPMRFSLIDDLKLKPETAEKVVASLQKAGYTLRDIGQAADNVKVKQIGTDLLQLDVTMGQGKATRKFSYEIQQVTGELDKLGAAAERAKQKKIDFDKVAEQLPGGTKTRDTIADILKSNGFSQSDLMKTNIEGSTGTTTMKFRQFDEVNKIFRDLSITTDKYGQVLIDTQRRFRSFGQQITQDIGKVFQWSIAVGVIYGSMYKLQELLQVAVDNEAKLANVSIALADSNKTTADIFDAVSEAAQKTGESLSGVIDGYSLAYRAAGGMADSEQRFSLANKILIDSITLSKLSTLEQAEATDVLTAALKQSSKQLTTSTENFKGFNNPLEGGTYLLDKWVQVTRIANVDMTTLALGFSIVGDAADAAGLSIEQLNAVIASVSETSPATGREVANATRAIIAGFQSDKAQKALEASGISLQKLDENGQLVQKTFLDLTKDIYDLKTAGAMSEETFSKLTLAIGGGTRRQAVVSTFISQYERLQEILGKQSADATGLAQEALAKKLNTVQTSIVQLGNAFQYLANSIGTEGGVLSLFKDLVDLATKLVTAISGITGAMGKAGPLLFGLGGGLMFLKGRPASQQKEIFAGMQSFGGNALGGFLRLLDPLVLGMDKLLGKSKSAKEIIDNLDVTGKRTSSRGMYLGQRVSSDIYNRFVEGQQLGPDGKLISLTSSQLRMNRMIGSASMIGLSALPNVMEGNWNKVGGNIAGGIAGALIGGPVGALVGSAVGEAFVNTTIDYKPQWENFFKDILTPNVETPTTGTNEENLAKQKEKFLNDVFADVGGGNTAIGKLKSTVGSFFANIFYGGYQYLNNATPLLANKKPNVPQGSITPEQYALFTGAQIPILGMSSKTNPDLLKQFYELQKNTEAAKGTGGSEYAQKIKQIQDTWKTALDDIKATEQTTLLNQLVSGKITVSEFSRSSEAIGDFTLKASRYYAAFGETFVEQNKNIKDAQGAFEAYIKLIATSPADAIGYLNTLTEQIATLDQQGKTLEADTLRKQAATFATTLMTSNAKANKIDVPGIVDFTNYGKIDLDKIIADAYAQQKQDIDAIIANGLVPSGTTAEMITSQISDILVEGAENAYIKLSGIDEKYLREMVSRFKERYQEVSKGLGITQFDMTYGEFQSKLPAYQNLMNQFVGMGYKPDEQQTIGVFKDVYSNVKVDMKIFQLLLEKLVDINQKQLDGMYNLPEGAEFYIPITAAYYRNKGGGGTADSSKALDNSAGNLNEAAKSLQDAATRLSNIGQYPTLPSLAQAGYTSSNDIVDWRKIKSKEWINQHKGYNAGISVHGVAGGDLGIAGGSIGAPASLAKRLGLETTKIEGLPDSILMLDAIFAKLLRVLSRLDTTKGIPSGITNSGLSGNAGIGFGGNAGIGLSGNAGGVIGQSYSKQGGYIGQKGGPVLSAPKNAGSGLNVQQTPVTTRLNIKLESRTYLYLDGRKIWESIKNYAHSDLIKYGSASGYSENISKTIV